MVRSAFRTHSQACLQQKTRIGASTGRVYPYSHLSHKTFHFSYISKPRQGRTKNGTKGCILIARKNSHPLHRKGSTRNARTLKKHLRVRIVHDFFFTWALLCVLDGASQRSQLINNLLSDILAGTVFKQNQVFSTNSCLQPQFVLPSERNRASAPPLLPSVVLYSRSFASTKH